MLVFLAALFFLLITPGPGVLSTAGVGAAYGREAGYRYVAGLCLGTNLVALAVVTGLAALMLAEPALRGALLALSVGYIAWLALRIGLAGSTVAFVGSARAPGIVDAVALQAINPKAYVVNTTLFTGFAFGSMSPSAETLWKFALINLVWVPIHLAWLEAGIALERLALSPERQRAVNLAMAASLLAVVALALLAGAGGGADGRVGAAR